MFNQHLDLSDRQTNSLVSFLIDSTDRTIVALEEVFGIDIDNSGSDLELAPIRQSVFLRDLHQADLYVVNSNMHGDLEGRFTVLLRGQDVQELGEIMRPILDILFQANPGADPPSPADDSLHRENPGDNHPQGNGSFRQQMVDFLSELGNVLIGRYAKSMDRIFRLSVNHTVPRVHPGPNRDLLERMADEENEETLHLVIENEFLVGERPIRLWCLISPTRSGLDRMLGETQH